MSKKRKREVYEIEKKRVELYEQLAHEDESQRLESAHALISKTLDGQTTHPEQVKEVLNRLFRGLCSSRKAARLGFSVALSGLLSRIHFESTKTSETDLCVSDVLNILESQTAAARNTSGQEIRDHYYGKLFGAEAIAKSGILYQSKDREPWDRLLNIICSLAQEKTWLRQECGWVLLKAVDELASKSSLQRFAVDILKKLKSQKLIRTPEGIAIWLHVKQRFPHSNLPDNLWQFGHPLASKDVTSLVSILKDAREESEGENGDFGAQGAARWSASLHFAWGIVLNKLYEPEKDNLKSLKGGTMGSDAKLVQFETFWVKVVDEGYFGVSSSTERRHTGFLLWNKVLETSPQDLLLYTLTEHVLNCLVTSLRSEEHYLRKSATRALQLFQSRMAPASTRADADLAARYIEALFRATSGDFDAVTNTKTLQKLMEISDRRVRISIAKALWGLLAQNREQDTSENRTSWKTVTNLQAKLLTAGLKDLTIAKGQKQDTDTGLKHEAEVVLHEMIKAAYFDVGLSQSPSCIVAPAAREMIRERIGVCIEQQLRSGDGKDILRKVVSAIRQLQDQGEKPLVSFEGDIAKTIDLGWKKFTLVVENVKHANHNTEKPKSKKGSDTDIAKTAEAKNAIYWEGLSLLYGLVLFQIYGGETEAVEILDDLLESPEQMDLLKDKNQKQDGEIENADALIEILLSFLSRPSKFMRRVTIQIFEAFSSMISQQGLKSLTRVLITKENARGQQEMFEAEESNEIGDDDERSDSEIDSVGSDVEVESATSSGTDDETEPTSESSSDDGDDDDDDDDDDDAELVAFDGALAAALGTVMGEDGREVDDPSGTSDSDMDDDQMMALDEKLSQVFRARKEKNDKSKQRHMAKEQMISFKNRVMDLIDAYLKEEYQNPLSVDLIVPLLTTIRTTKVKQLADRACHVLRDFCSRCKGPKVPVLEADNEEHKQYVVNLLRQVHDEACWEASNAHSAAASQASILLVKTLIHGGIEVQVPVNVYGETRIRQLADHRCKVQPAFFTDWNNWCAQARKQLAR